MKTDRMQRSGRGYALSLAFALALAGCGGGGGSSGSLTPLPSPTAFTITTPAPLLPPSVGVMYAQGLALSGGDAPYAWDIPTPGDLPPGLSLGTSTSTTNLLSGVPQQAGTFSFAVRATDASGRVTSRSYTLHVTGELAVSTATLPAGQKRFAYAETVAATGGLGPYAWSVTTPLLLPPGITLGFSTAASVPIEGTPTQPGSFTFTVRVEDAEGRFDESDLTIDVANSYEVILRADFDTPGMIELFRGIFDGTGLANLEKLNDTIIPTGGDVASTPAPERSPDGTKLVYAATAEIQTRRELYVVDLETLVVTKPMTFSNPSGSSLNVSWSPDSQKFAFRASAESSTFELYVADLRGATPTCQKVSLGFSTPTAGPAALYVWSADSRYLAVRLNTTSTETDLYLWDTALAQPYPLPTQLNTNRVASGGDVEALWWVPGQNVMLFAGDMETANRDELYLVDVRTGTPTAPTNLTSALSPPSGANVSVNQTRGLRNDFSPDGTRFAIRYLNFGGSSIDRVLVAPVVSGGLGTFTDTVAAGDVNAYDWSPDSTRVLLNTGSTVAGLDMVDVSQPTASWTVVSVTTLNIGSTNPEGNWGFTPDGQRVHYRNSSRESFLIDVTTNPTGAPQRVDGPVVATTGSPIGVGVPAGTNHTQVSPDSGRFFYLSAQNEGNVFEAFLADVSGAVPVQAIQLNPTPATNGDCLDPSWASDSRFVFFRGDVAVNDQHQLFAFDAVNGTSSADLIDLAPGQAPGATGVSSYQVFD